MQCNARLASPAVLHVILGQALHVFQFRSSTIAACCVPVDSAPTDSAHVVVLALGDGLVASLSVPPAGTDSPASAIVSDHLLSTLGAWPLAQLGPAHAVACVSPSSGVFVLCSHGWACVGRSDAAVASASVRSAENGASGIKNCEAEPWPAPAAALRSVALLPPGPLRDSLRVSGLPSAPAAVLTGDISGRVCCVPGTDAGAALRVVIGAAGSAANATAPRASLHRDKGCGGSVVRAELVQETCLCAVNGHHGSIAVVVGVLGACVALWPATPRGQGQAMNTTRFNLPTDGRALRKAFLVVLTDNADQSIHIANLSSGAHVVLRLASSPPTAEGGVAIPDAGLVNKLAVHTYRRRDICSLAVPVSPMVDQHGQALRELLKGIDAASERRKSAVDRAACCDRTAASLNAATLFALAWKGSSTPASETPLSINCDLRGSALKSSHTENIYYGSSSPWAGARAAIIASLTLGIDIEMDVGWVLHLYWRSSPRPLRVADEPTKSPSDHARGGTVQDHLDNNPDKTLSGPKQSTSTGVLRSMSCRINQLEVGKANEYYFPIHLSSHAPISVSASLVFYRNDRLLQDECSYAPNSTAQPGIRSQFGSDAHLPHDAMLRIPLVSSYVLDILDFSDCIDKVDPRMSTKPGDEDANVNPPVRKEASFSTTSRQRHYISHQSILPDTSHQTLPTGRIAGFFDPTNRQGRTQPRVTSTQLQVPMTKRRLTQVLMDRIHDDVADNISSITKKTALGAYLVFELLRGSNEQSTVLSIRAVPHAIPFVRAAVLRRVLRFLSTSGNSSVSTTEQSRALKQRERSILDAVNEAQKSLRQAEGNLSDLDRLIDDILGNMRLDACASEQDIACVHDTLRSLNLAYQGWRQGSKDLLI